MSARLFLLLPVILTLFTVSSLCEVLPEATSNIYLEPDEVKSINSEIDITLESTSLWSKMTQVAVYGNYAYCIVPYGLIILDISDISDPQYVGKCYLPGAGDVVVDGDYAYIACGDRWAKINYQYGLRVVDISDPFNPVLTGEYELMYKATGIDIQGNHAFVANHMDGLQIFDISDPSSPVLVGHSPTEYFTSDVVVRGDYAYIADYYGVKVVDISDVSNPVMTDIKLTAEVGPSDRLALNGNYIYVVEAFFGIGIYDISDPYNIVQEENFCPGGYFKDIAITNSTAFLTLRDTTLMIADLSNATSPSILGVYDSSMPYPTNSGLDVSGNHAFIADSSMLRIVDITDYSAPAQVGYYAVPGPPLEVVVSGDHAYIANRSGMEIMNISDPANPYEAGYFWTPDKAFDIAIDDTIAYVTDAFYGIRIVNISDPSTPVEILQYDTPGFAYFVEVYENCLYIGDDDSLRVLEISDPANPVRLASLWLPGTTRDIAFRGDHAFVADYDEGIHVFDISDPAECARVTSFNFGGWIPDVYIQGDYLYALAGVEFGIRDLQIIDISTPSSPILRSVYRFQSSPFDVKVIGDYAYVAGSYTGLYILNVSNPSSPSVVGNYITIGYASGLDVAGNHIYMVDYGGFMIFSYEPGLICGDANNDGNCNIGDAIYLISYVFKDGPAPSAMTPGDANGDCDINVGDAVYIISHVFTGGDPPICNDECEW